MKKPHILFIVENNPVMRDGRVLNEMAAAIQFGYDVSVIAPRDEMDLKVGERVEGAEVYEHPRFLEGHGVLGLIAEYINALLWEFALSLRVFFHKRVDIIHAANPPDHLFLIALMFKPLGVKFVFDHHDLTPENFVAKFGHRGLLYNSLRLMEWLTFKIADAVIATNESYKAIALGRGGKKNSEVFVVRNGPDPARHYRRRTNGDLRKGAKYLVGYVGTIGQQDCIENLLAVAEYIRRGRSRSDVRFIVVGTGPNLGEVQSLCRRLNLEECVEFTGFVSDEKLSEILSSVDVCVNPEMRNDFTDRSTMIKVMEYMAFSQAIVQYYTTEGAATAAEAADYVMEATPEAFGDTLLSLLENDERRRLLGAIGRSRVEQLLSWDRQKEGLAAAYRFVLQSLATLAHSEQGSASAFDRK